MTDQKIPDDGPAPTVDAERVPEPGWTGGEWRIEGFKLRGDAIVGYIISAGVNTYGDGPASYVGDVMVSKPDAVLMAASKDLYAALELAVAEVEDLRNYANNHGGMIDEVEFIEGRAALAKALGKRAEIIPSQALDKAADLITPDGAWLRDGISRNAAGREVGFNDPAAVSWCMAAAALRAVAPFGVSSHVAVISMLRRITGPCIPSFNGAPDRTQADVVAALRKAADLAREEGQ